MTESQTIACEKCRWFFYRKPPLAEYFCMHPTSERHWEADPITGKKAIFHLKCRDMRGSDNYCGIEGKFFERRWSLWRKLNAKA